MELRIRIQFTGKIEFETAFNKPWKNQLIFLGFFFGSEQLPICYLLNTHICYRRIL